MVHHVLFDGRGVDRAKSADADVQGCEFERDLSLGQLLKECLREVQSRRWSGDSPRLFRIDGLIRQPIGFGHFPIPNIRRQRHAAHFFQQSQSIPHRLRPHGPDSAAEVREQPQTEFLPNIPGDDGDGLSRFQLAASLAENLPVPVFVGTEKKSRPASPCPLPPADESGRNDPRVIQNKCISGR